MTDPADYEAIVVALREGGVPRALPRPSRCKGLRAHRKLRRGDLTWSRRDRRHPAGAARLAGKIRERRATARTRISRRALPDRRGRADVAARTPELQGKELSYNNINDADAAFELSPIFLRSSRPW